MRVPWTVRRSNQSILKEINPEDSSEGLMLKLQYSGHPKQRSGKENIEGGRRRGQTEDEMVGWHHRLDGHEFEQAPGVGDGQGSLACCSPWGRKEPDMTEQLNNISFLGMVWLLLLPLLEYLSMGGDSRCSYWGPPISCLTRA